MDKTIEIYTWGNKRHKFCPVDTDKNFNVAQIKEGGTFDTDLYLYTGSEGLDAGTLLYDRILDADTNGKLTNDTSNVADNGDGSTILAVAQVTHTLSDEEASAGKALQIRLLI